MLAVTGDSFGCIFLRSQPVLGGWFPVSMVGFLGVVDYFTVSVFEIKGAWFSLTYCCIHSVYYPLSTFVRYTAFQMYLQPSAMVQA